jgi:thiosulfate reductase cytochrome b subunit
MQKKRMTHVITRHPLVVRITHWVVALSLFVLAMSGMQIFNAHPALYASDASNFSSPILSISGETDAQGNPHGWVQIGRLRVPTTHVLGWGDDGQGGEVARAFPGWATIPSEQDLADGRRWHIFFAWIFVLCALAYARFAVRLIPTKADFKALPHTLKEHLKPWKIPPSPEPNPLQKVAYFGVVWIVAPLVIISGLALSPSVDAWAPWLPAILGGRQFARVWHFAAWIALTGFFVGHIAMVVLTGFINNMRSMITGRFAVKGAK